MSIGVGRCDADCLLQVLLKTAHVLDIWSVIRISYLLVHDQGMLAYAASSSSNIPHQRRYHLIQNIVTLCQMDPEVNILPPLSFLIHHQY